MGDSIIRGVGNAPDAAKSGFEQFIEKIQHLLTEENIAQILEILRKLLKIWDFAVKFKLVRFNDKQRELNDNITGAANEVLNPK